MIFNRLSKRIIGDKYENMALLFLTDHNLTLIQKNYYCKLGEIDLIMQDNNHIVFVEVRYRKNTNFGHPLETINNAKQLKIKKTALHYLQAHKKLDNFCRFDAISITENNKINWIKNAFE